MNSNKMKVNIKEKIKDIVEKNSTKWYLVA
jgi:hypothetical protein